MSGGWRGSDRRTRLPEDWPQRVAAVKVRDRGRCQWPACRRAGKEVDHIARGDDHRLDNLQLLCWPHHQVKTLREAQAAKAAKRASRKRPQEQHPGARR